MANVKISDLTGAASASGTQEFEVNDSGTSKKVTGSQLATFIEGEVSSSPTLTGQVSLDNGTNTAPSLTNTGDTNTGLYFPSDDTVGLAAGGGLTLSANASGVDVTGTLTSDGLTVEVADGFGVDLTGGAGSFSEASYYWAQGQRASFGYDGSRVSISDKNANGLTGNKSLRVSLGGADRLFVNHNTGDISFYEDTGTTPKFFWDASAERLGLGTVLPSTQLDVVGGIRSTSSGGYNQITTTSIGDAVFDNNGNNWLTVKDGVPANAMRIGSNGDVGIGTSSPQEKLHVIGSAKLDFGSGGGNPRLYFDHDTVTDDANYIQLNRGDAGLEIVSEDNIKFDTNGSEHMRIDASGSVGIGTSSPDQKLTISGTTTQQIKVIATEDGSDMRIGASSFSTGSGFIGTNSNHPVTFITNNTERMRIDSSGSLLVNTTSKLIGSETAKFSSTGSGSNTLVLTHDSTDDRGILVTLHSGSSGGTSRTHAAFLNSGGFEVGSIKANGSSTSFTTSSDYRLKTDAQPMTGASARVQALNPVNFEWLSDGTRVDGFLAHEAQEVVPEAVTGTKDAVDADGNPEYQGIDQSKLVPLLTAALQEALTKIDALETRITALEG